jgi:hypothetical protein
MNTATITLNPAFYAAAYWLQRTASLPKHQQPFNGLHLSVVLEQKVASACTPRTAPEIATLQTPTANVQTIEPLPVVVEPVTAPIVEPPAEVVVVAPPAPKTARIRKPGMVAVRQALLSLGVTVTRIAELTGTDRRSAHKHANATASSKVKPWNDRSDAERSQALQMAQTLLGN